MASPLRRKPTSLAEFDPRPNKEATDGQAKDGDLRAPSIEIREDGLPQSFFVTAADRKRLRHYCVEVEKSFNEIAHEAFREYFEKRGLPPLQFQTANRASGGRKK